MEIARRAGAVLIAVVLGAVPTFAETPVELAGRVTAYAEACGYYSDAAEMKTRYGEIREFEDALAQNDLSGADVIQRLECDRIERALKLFLAPWHAKQVGHSSPDDTTVRCQRPGADVATYMLPSMCAQVGGKALP